MRFPTNVRTRLAAAFSALTLLAVAGSVHAQFAAPTCTPPNCNPEVIQNVDISGAAQVASINISGSQKLGGTFQTGALAPVLTAASDNLMYGNVGGTSTNGSLLLLQFGAVDRLRVTLTGQLQLPIGSAGAPSYSFIGDTNTGLYSSVGDSMSFATNGVARTTINNSGLTVNSGVLAVPSGTNAAPSITFTGDTNTGIFRGTADTINFVTNGVTGMTVSATNNVVIPGALTVNGTFTSSGGIGGDGSALTNLNASNITTGTLNDARLSTNVATYTGGGTFTGANTFSNASNSFTGSGAGLTSLNATNISSGTLNDARLSSNVALYNANGTFTGNNTFSGMTSYGSAALPVIGAQNLIYGNVDTTSTGALLLLQNESVDRFRVSATGAVTATSFAGNGASLTNLNASNLSSGTVPSARLSGTYSNNLTFSGQTSFGSAAAVVGAGQNLVYGNMDATSLGNLLLLQNESVDRFRVDAAGNLTLSGTIAASGTLTSGGVNVCLQNGTNCPATLGGSGTDNYLTKFTGGGSLVTNSQIQDDGSTVGIGIAPQSSKLYVNGAIAANSTISTYQVAAGAVGVSGQVVGVGSTGVAGNGGSYGVYGSSGGYGVYGYNTSAGASGAGVYGYGTGSSPGVQGDSQGGWGGSFSSLYVTPGTAYFASGANMGFGTMILGNLGFVPTGANGAMYYDTASNKMRCYENGAWMNCINTLNAWSTINASAGTDPVPDSAADTLNITGGTAITVTGDATTDTLTIANTGVTSAIAGAGMSVSGATGAVTFTNIGDTNASDDLTGLTGGAGISISGAAPNLTVTNTGVLAEADTLATVTGRGATTTTAISVNSAGTAISGTGVGAGVYGTAASSGGVGVQGVMTAASGYGVYGTSSGSGGNGVYGNAGAANGIGVNGLGGYIGVAGTGPYGVYGDGASSGTYAAGVYGSGYHGVEGVAENNGYGLYGSGGSYGVYGSGSYMGLYGAGGTYGLYATGSSYAIYGGGNARFTGDTWVGGNLGVGASPSRKLDVRGDARIDGPLYMYSTSGPQISIESNPGYDMWQRFWAYGASWFAAGFDYSHNAYAINPGSSLNEGGFLMNYTNGYVGLGLGYNAGYRLDLPNVASTSGRGRANSWTTYSDRRYKENIENTKGSLAQIAALKPVSFTWKGQDVSDIGFIAQDVEKILPEVVSTDASGYKALDYGRLTAPIVGAIQEQQAEIDDLKTVIKNLESRLEALERR